MSKEAMKLALDALGEIEWSNNSQWQSDRAKVAITALRQALAAQPAQQGPVAWQYRDARDDGTWGAWIGCDKRLAEDEYRQVRALYASPQPAPVQQEPVAVVSGYYGGQCVILPIDPARIYNSNTPLYTSPQPCPTCEALARTVMLDQTSHDAQRKPLTDEELRVIENKINPNMRWRSSDEEGITLYPSEYYDLVKAIEAAHGIKEQP